MSTIQDKAKFKFEVPHENKVSQGVMKEYNHINQQEQELIFLYHNQGKNDRDIGKLLGRDQMETNLDYLVSTIQFK